MTYSVLGKPVEKCDDVDYVLTVFTHSMTSKTVELKSAEHQKRIDKRRKVVEAEEFDKKNRRAAEECEMKCVEEAAESLLLLKDTGKVHVQTQTDTQEQKTIGTQCSNCASHLKQGVHLLKEIMNALSLTRSCHRGQYFTILLHF